MPRNGLARSGEEYPIRMAPAGSDGHDQSRGPLDGLQVVGDTSSKVREHEADEPRLWNPLDEARDGGDHQSSNLLFLATGSHWLGNQRQKGLIKNTFRRSKKVTGGPFRPIHTEGAASSQPASQSQPSPPLPPPTASSPQFHSPDPRFPSPDVTQSTPFYPYYPPPPSHGVPPPYPYPYLYPPYVPPPPQPSIGELSTPAAAQQATEGRMLIEPDGDTFHPSKQPTHKIWDIIRSRYDAPYLSWKKVPKDVQDMWFREFEKDFCWLPQHNDKIRKNFERRGSIRMRDIFTDIRKVGELPLWIGEGVWAELTTAWVSPDYSKRRDQNRQNRASDVGGLGSSLHTGGSVPHTEHRRRLKEMLGREPTSVELHSHTHKQQEDKQWVDERARRAYEEYTRLRESQAAAGEGPSGGSTEISDYRTWSQAVGGVQHGRIYGLGSQAYTYEWQTSGSSSFLPSTQESLYTQQIAALTAELEQVRKSQADWQMQMQQQLAEMQRQQAEMLEEMRKMREHISSGRSTTADEETDSE
ncbi:hypothetical protein M5K25_003702 [Dendrobium thyrsiflorum]|uniref:Transposase, Ptta/En/Spm, plant n=1 Tax=Dendrobium thyrsiflorum TaxID=117978 RepID=A0ABD0VSF8_DENTH